MLTGKQSDEQNICIPVSRYLCSIKEAFRPYVAFEDLPRVQLGSCDYEVNVGDSPISWPLLQSARQFLTLPAAPFTQGKYA